MSAGKTIFPSPPAAPAPPVVEVTEIIETVGVEVLEEPLSNGAQGSKAPANGNDVIPFASTLRRVG